MPKETNKTQNHQLAKKKKGKSVFSESKLLVPRGNQFYQTNLRGFSSKCIEKLKFLVFFLYVKKFLLPDF